jgi:hypothetical protein
MVSEIPKLLGRGFLIGFILPSTVYCAFILAILQQNELVAEVSWETIAKASNAGLAALLILFVAVLLLALNRSVVRLLEGYPIDYFLFSAQKSSKLGKLIWDKYQKKIRKHFNAEVQPILDEMARLEQERETNPLAVSKLPNFQRELLKATRYFPDQAQHVLPTRFGNAMRAFEVYPRVVYGMESIQAWNRLLLILPRTVVDRVQESRTPLDFNVNMIVLALPTVALIAYMAARHGYQNALWSIAPIFVIVFCWMSLPNLAVQWGDMVRSVFDVYRGQLAREMGLTVPRRPHLEREMWISVSRMMSYRRGRAFDALSRFRREQPSSPSAKSDAPSSGGGKGE